MRRLRGALALVCVGAVVAGCGASGPPSGVGNLTGRVVLDGDSDVAAISQFAAEEFVRFHPNVRVRLDRSGEGAALRHLCRGTVDIVHATRESPSCGRGGVELRVARVAVDALAVIVRRDVRWPACMSLSQLRWLVAGSRSPWIRVVGADRARGYSALRGGSDDGVRRFPPADEAVAAAVRRDPGAIGFISAGALPREPGVRPVAVAERGGCVGPDSERIRDGSYRTLTRPVLLVFRADVSRNRGAHALLRFAVSEERVILGPALLFAAGRDDHRRAEQAVG